MFCSHIFLFHLSDFGSSYIRQLKKISKLIRKILSPPRRHLFSSLLLGVSCSLNLLTSYVHFAVQFYINLLLLVTHINFPDNLVFVFTFPENKILKGSRYGNTTFKIDIYYHLLNSLYEKIVIFIL